MLFSFLRRKLNYLRNLAAADNNEPPEYNDKQKPDQSEKPGQGDLNESLEENVDALKRALSNGSDLVTHKFRFGPDHSFTGVLVSIDGLIDRSVVTDAILRPIIEWLPFERAVPKENLAQTLSMEVLYSGEIKTVSTLPELAAACLSGDIVLLLEGCTIGLDINAKGWDKRSVSEPQSETVVRGPREGFTENLRTNTALLRRKIKSGKLCVEFLTIGRRTQTGVCLMYLEDVADPDVVKTVKHRIEGVDVDSILESHYIEEYIEDAPLSPFPTIGSSEKPDVVAGRVLEGRVAIVVDGTPFVLTVPMLFVESFQASEDYYVRTPYASFIRLLRYFAFMIAVFAPAIYIALTVFHPELIPTTLLFSLSAAREGVPFPAFLEALIMLIAFEILREGGIRLPGPVGQAISIVGALVMGDAAVSAGLIGAPMVITIAITAVASFLVPGQNGADSLLRIALMALAAFAGFYGVVMGFIAILIHLSTLSSFGVAYFDGFAWIRNLQDSVIRMPLWSMVRRPKHIAKGDTLRRRFFVPPLRPYAQKENEETAGENS